MELVLASASPRRVDLLRSIGLEFAIRPADVDESLRNGERPTTYVERLAEEKCRAVRSGTPDTAAVLAADTVVVLDDDVLGKPTGDDDARQMLRRLSGRTHLVHTAVCVGTAADVANVRVTTEVTFARLSESDITWYVGRGESLDKAGGYGIQSAGGALVERIVGSPSNVVGLPLRETVVLLRAAGVGTG